MKYDSWIKDSTEKFGYIFNDPWEIMDIITTCATYNDDPYPSRDRMYRIVNDIVESNNPLCRIP